MTHSVKAAILEADSSAKQDQSAEFNFPFPLYFSTSHPWTRTNLDSLNATLSAALRHAYFKARTRARRQEQVQERIGRTFRVITKQGRLSTERLCRAIPNCA